MRPGPIALIVSADREVRHVIVAGLQELGCRTIEATTHAEGLESARHRKVDVAVVDMGRPEALQGSFMRELQVNQPGLKVVCLIAPFAAGFTSGLEARTHVTCLQKPFRLDELCDLVSWWLEDCTRLLMTTGTSLH